MLNKWRNIIEMKCECGISVKYDGDCSVSFVDAWRIADWVFSLKVQRGEDINETTYDKCMETAKMWVRKDEAKRNVREGME
jgi:hypothetical protein